MVELSQQPNDVGSPKFGLPCDVINYSKKLSFKKITIKDNYGNNNNSYI